MKITLMESSWLDEQHEISLTELVELSGLTEAEIRELVGYGALNPLDPEAEEWAFCGKCLVTVRTASRLRDDFELNSHTLALALSFVDRIRELEMELSKLRAQLPHRAR